MPSVSLSFLITLCGIAIVAAALSLVRPDPVFGITALLLGLFGVYGLGLRFLLREQDEQVDELRNELEQEKASLAAERAERSAVENQFIGVRVGKRSAKPDLTVH